MGKRKYITLLYHIRFIGHYYQQTNNLVVNALNLIEIDQTKFYYLL
jgi:hypothetical protein